MAEVDRARKIMADTIEKDFDYVARKFVRRSYILQLLYYVILQGYYRSMTNLSWSKYNISFPCSSNQHYKKKILNSILIEWNDNSFMYFKLLQCNSAVLRIFTFLFLWYLSTSTILFSKLNWNIMIQDTATYLISWKQCCRKMLYRNKLTH